MVKDNTKPRFNEVLNQLSFESFCFLIKEDGTDRYVRRLIIYSSPLASFL